MSLAAKLLSVLLLLQAGAFWGCTRSEIVPPMTNLKAIAKEHATWKTVQESQVTAAEQEILKADETLTRLYIKPGMPSPASLYIASFLTQRSGRAPHSPKNCLPGAGWSWEVSDVRQIPVEGRAEPIQANHHIIQKGESKSVVYYWYQSRDRTVASEYWAKAYVVLDAIRYNRTDTSLVRVIVNVHNNDIEAAEKAALDLIKNSYSDIRKQLPA
jgi:EpsI family protein